MTEEEILSDPDLEHVVSVSGGKDSSATYCTALETGVRFRAVAADTGNEHPKTYEQVNNLHIWTGGPQVEWVKGDFTGRLRRKRDFIAKNWCRPRGKKPAVPQDLIDRALAILDDRLAHPEQANPYLDLCLWKGRFPSRKAQFCTEELKVHPINRGVTIPLLKAGKTVISWQGVRAAEGGERKYLEPIQELNAETICGCVVPGRLIVYRPLLRVESVEEVFAISARHGVPPNPLYAWGLSRVGCFPCINCSKAELALVDTRFPEQIDRLERWESLVSDASRRGHSTFFAIVNDPVMASEIAYHEALGSPLEITKETHGVRRMVEWAKTDRGGRMRILFEDAEPPSACHTHGACE